MCPDAVIPAMFPVLGALLACDPEGRMQRAPGTPDELEACNQNDILIILNH